MITPKDLWSFGRGLWSIPFGTMWRVMRVFIHGAWKHRHDLYTKKGSSVFQQISHVNNHMQSWNVAPDFKDPDTGQLHITHATCRLMITETMYRKRVKS